MIFVIDQHTDEVNVFDSVDQLTSMVEWQDILNDEIAVIDERGNLYKWDSTKSEEIGTIYNYTMTSIGANMDLSQKCNKQYSELNQPNTFSL